MAPSGTGMDWSGFPGPTGTWAMRPCTISSTALLRTRFQWDRPGADGAGSRKAGSRTSSSARVQYIIRSVGTNLWDVGSPARPSPSSV